MSESGDGGIFTIANTRALTSMNKAERMNVIDGANELGGVLPTMRVKNYRLHTQKLTRQTSQVFRQKCLCL